MRRPGIKNEPRSRRLLRRIVPLNHRRACKQSNRVDNWKDKQNAIIEVLKIRDKQYLQSVVIVPRKETWRASVVGSHWLVSTPNLELFEVCLHPVTFFVVLALCVCLINVSPLCYASQYIINILLLERHGFLKLFSDHVNVRARFTEKA